MTVHKIETTIDDSYPYRALTADENIDRLLDATGLLNFRGCSAGNNVWKAPLLLSKVKHQNSNLAFFQAFLAVHTFSHQGTVLIPSQTVPQSINRKYKKWMFR